MPYPRVARPGVVSTTPQLHTCIVLRQQCLSPCDMKSVCHAQPMHTLNVDAWRPQMYKSDEVGDVIPDTSTVLYATLVTWGATDNPFTFPQIEFNVVIFTRAFPPAVRAAQGEVNCCIPGYGPAASNKNGMLSLCGIICLPPVASGAVFH